jgi:poly(hydroxyalkanoate) depolymerase family esterase
VKTLSRVLPAFALGALVLVAPHAKATTAHGSFTKHSYTLPGTTMSRDYWLYLPAGGAVAGRPVVVDLHGCNQTATQAATAWRFNQLADKRNFVVVYPQQNVTTNSSAPVADGNGIGCWNWFLPQDQVRGKGEPALIAGITRSVLASTHADPRRVYVEGASAGADMAVILAATYPDVYRAAAALAGCAYRTCGDTTGQLAYRAMGNRARTVPLFVENGTADPLNNYAMARGLVTSWLGTDDYTDDGQLNRSVPRRPASIGSHDLRQVPRPGSGDPCVHNDSATCPGGVIGFQKSYPYTVERYNSRSGCELMQMWTLHGMSHAIPNAPSGTPYGDPLGPDITTASYDFFTSARTCQT